MAYERLIIKYLSDACLRLQTTNIHMGSRKWRARGWNWEKFGSTITKLYKKPLKTLVVVWKTAQPLSVFRAREHKHHVRYQ